MSRKRMKQDLSSELADKDFKLIADGHNDYLWHKKHFVRSMSPDYSIRVLNRYCRLYKRRQDNDCEKD